MPTLPFGEFRPDLNELDGTHSRSLMNVLAQGDGYGPIRDVAALTKALPAQCRGYFYARNTDGSVSVFAGTATKLYRLNNTFFTWDDVSLGAGTYTTLDTSAQWQFAQFNSFVIAVQKNDDPQVFQLGVSSAFADLGGNPPNAAHVTVVGRQLVLSGLQGNPFRVNWSALNDITGWTAGTDGSDFQDLPDGGIVRRVLGGEVGVILQDQVIRRMIFVGGDLIFTIERIASDIGLLHPYGATIAADKIFFISTKGFYQSDASGSMVPIGAERVDRYFSADHDAAQPQYVIAAADPRSNIVIFTYRQVGSATEGFTKALAYNYLLQRWTPLMITGEYVTSLAQPGLTIEGLDAVAPGSLEITGAADNGAGLIRIEVDDTSGMTDSVYRTISGVTGTTEANGTWLISIIDGTHFDLIEDTLGNPSAFSNAYVDGGIVGGFADQMEISWDSIAAAMLPNISVADMEHKIGFFAGDNLQATLETAEQSLDGLRMLVKGFSPVTDSATVSGYISKRENLNAPLTYTNAATMRGDGFCSILRSTMYSRAKIVIPAATVWTFATGVRPVVGPDGEV